MPGLEDLPVSKSLPDSRAEMARFQMINCHFLVVLFVLFCFPKLAKKGLNHDLRAQDQIVGAVLNRTGSCGHNSVRTMFIDRRASLIAVVASSVMGITFCVIPEASRIYSLRLGNHDLRLTHHGFIRLFMRCATRCPSHQSTNVHMHP
ncbi:hypothetical protein BKA70DRAFT_836852 [Coprinopsis sp. MPI-PUGE-AT-0042]|nr:hypothetical protein BKA70DRAFT_836852 [Coprinopsis sp. MPI-PUGE-AT-0042]